MTPPRSIVGTLSRLFANPVIRIGSFLIVIAALLLLAAFPERFRASTTLTPTDPASLGLSGTLGQLGALNSVFGNQAAVEVALRVGTSKFVRNDVIRQTNLASKIGERNSVALHRWLEDEVTIRSLRGGIVLIEMQGRDTELMKEIISAYATATRDRLAEVNRRQTNYKRQVLNELVSEASQQLAQAEANYNSFRTSNRYADPDVALDAIALRIPALQDAIQSKQIQLNTARRVYGESNVVISQLNEEIRSLRAQLRQIQSTEPGGSEDIAETVRTSGQLFRLTRELTLAQNLYDNYLRYLEGTAVEDLTSTANIRILEEAHIDTERQYWLPPLAAAAMVLLLWLAIEFYRLRPPVGEMGTSTGAA